MPNIAVVVLDTLRKDAFDKHFEWLPGRRYENAWSPSHWTVPVHGAMFTGKYPTETGTYAKSEHLNYESDVLAEALQKNGYRTRAFSANPYVSSTFRYDRGFNEFTGSWRLRQFDPELFDWNRFISERQGEGPIRYLRAISRCIRDDCRTLPSLKHGFQLKLRDLDLSSGVNDDGAAEALEYVRTTDFGDDEFLFINLMEAHTPYDPPEEYRTVDATHGLGLEGTITDSIPDSEYMGDIRQAYDDCVRYLSDIYNEIFDELAGDFEYILTVSDHGELLGEHGGWAHGYGLYPELTHVPLVVFGPDIEDGKETQLTSLLDVHATVLDATSIARSSRGKSLLSEETSDACLTEYHGLTGRQTDKLRDEGIEGTIIDSYDQVLRGIALSEDYYGYETVDGFVESGDNSSKPGQERLQALVDTLDRAEVSTGEKEELSEDVVKQLKDLGYA